MSMVAESVGIQDPDIVAQRTMAIEDCAAATEEASAAVDEAQS